MLARLDRWPVEPEDMKFPDISLLSPTDQDRVHELFTKMGDPDERVQPTISEAELKELAELLRGLPLVDGIEQFSGPKIEVPQALEYYWKWTQPAAAWRHYSFYEMGKVETLRFVALCARYGWQDGLGGVKLKECMVPLGDWHPDDRAEMTELLDKAARV